MQKDKRGSGWKAQSDEILTVPVLTLCLSAKTKYIREVTNVSPRLTFFVCIFLFYLHTTEALLSIQKLYSIVWFTYLFIYFGIINHGRATRRRTGWKKRNFRMDTMISWLRGTAKAASNKRLQCNRRISGTLLSILSLIMTLTNHSNKE